MQSDWASAAQTFSDLAQETGDPADRLAAMRSLAQAQRLNDAIAEGERLMASAAGLPEADRGAAVSELANLHEANGYRLRRAGDAVTAARAFERANDLDPSRVRLLAEAGYARLAAGDRRGAADRFVQAIDRLPAPTPGEASAVAGSGESVAGTPAGEEPPLRERLRREVLEARRTWTLSAFQSWRPSGSEAGRGNGPGAGAAGLQRDGLIAAQGGAELAVRLPDLRTDEGVRQAEVFARALWSQQGESLQIDHRSVQGGVGLRWQPLVGSAWRITAERLISVGEEARDDWLLRLGWGATMGDRPSPGAAYWPAGQFYAEAGRFFGDGGSTALYAEGRLGLSVPVQSGWTLTPHGVVAARELRPDPTSESWAEAGLGLALRRAFGGTAHAADRGRFEWLMQYRWGLSGAGRQGWLFAGSVLW
jgi:tetratricopeptide (TPR) repeat protein